MTTDLFIIVCDKMLKVLKAGGNQAYPFKNIDERRSAREFFISKGVEVAYDKDDGKTSVVNDDQEGFRLLVKGSILSYALYAYDENGVVQMMRIEDALQVKAELEDNKGISCRLQDSSKGFISKEPEPGEQPGELSAAAESNVGTLENVPVPEENPEAKKLAAIAKISIDTEKITRRNMKIQVSEYIQNRCETDAELAAQVMNPKKSIEKCFRYINRMAQEWILAEAKARGEELRGGYGDDVPDDICFGWAVEYFQKAELPEDGDKPKPSVPPAARPKKEAKDAAKKTKDKKGNVTTPGDKKPKIEKLSKAQPADGAASKNKNDADENLEQISLFG